MITCRCGATSITLAEKRVLAAAECCCCDCRLAGQWCADQGGPVVEQVPQLNVFVPSSVESVKGRENLKLFKLRAGGETTRAVATCCFTTLLASNWGYIGSVFLVPPAAKRAGFQGTDPTPLFRVFSKWWPSQWPPLRRALEYPAYVGLPSILWQLRLFFGVFVAARLAGHRGSLFKELGNVTVLDLPKERAVSEQWTTLICAVGTIGLAFVVVLLAVYFK